MKNKTTYTRKVASTQWAGFYDHQTVTRNAHNRKRSHARSTQSNSYTGVLIGASLWVTTFISSIGTGLVIGETYPQLINTASAQEIVHTPEESPVLHLEPSEGEALEAEAGQQEATPSAALKSEKQQILEYIVEVFGEDAADAIVVVRKCENSAFNPRAVNYNRNGTVDRGIFQLNSQYWGGEELFDWKTNIDKAYEVFTRAGKKWSPWTCAHVVDQKNYLNQ